MVLLFSNSCFAKTAYEYFVKAERQHNAGNLHKAVKAYKKAEKQYTKVIDKNPNEHMSYYYRGLARYQLNKPEECIEDLTKAITYNPDWPAVYNFRGNCKSNLGDYKAAIKDYSKAIELAPEFATAYTNRGIAKYNMVKLKKAMEDFDKALKMNPYDRFAIFYKNKAKNTQEALEVED